MLEFCAVRYEEGEVVDGAAMPAEGWVSGLRDAGRVDEKGSGVGSPGARVKTRSRWHKSSSCRVHRTRNSVSGEPGIATSCLASTMRRCAKNFGS